MKFHHLGFVVDNIDSWQSRMIHEKLVKEVVDPIQKARLVLYKNYSDILIELIQPLSPDSYTWRFRQKGASNFHHLCYEVGDLKTLSKIEEKYRLIPVLEPVPAILFDHKFVTFYMDRNKQIIEFLILNHEN